LAGINKDDVKLIRVGVNSIIWALWNVQNDHVFNRPKALLFAGYTRRYALDPYMVQLVEQRNAMDSRCNRLKTVAGDLFNQFGWRRDNRILAS
jgi:hypothetical protein